MANQKGTSLKSAETQAARLLANRRAAMADGQVLREGHMYRRCGNANRSWSSWKKQWCALRTRNP